MSSFNQRGCFGCGGPLDGLLCRRCTCEWCGNNLRNGFCSICDSGAGNSFVYDPNPNSFNDPLNFFNHPPQPQYETYSCELCGNDSHYGFDCPPRIPLVYEQEPSYNQNFGDNYYPQNSPSFPQQYLCCENCGGPHENFQCQPRNQNYFESNPCYNLNSYGFDQPTQTSIDHQPPKERSVRELLLQEKLHKALQSVYEKLNQQEQATTVSTHTPEPSRRFNIIYDYDDDDDDDEKSTIPLNEITSQIPLSIANTPVLPIEDSEDSLIMEDENLSTIPEKESDEFIKFSVEDLVPIPSESEDTFENDRESDLPFCDNSVTFSNHVFNDNDDFTSSYDESLLEEDVPKENFKIYSNPLFKFDDEYISSDVNPLFNEVLKDIENKESYVSNLDELALLVTPLSDANEDVYFDPRGDIDEIDAFLDIDASTDIKDGYHDSERDIIYLESLLINDTIPNLHPEVFLDHDPRSFKDEPDNDELKNMVKVFDLGMHEKIISPTYVRLPFEDPLSKEFSEIDLLVSFPYGNKDKIFNPGIFIIKRVQSKRFHIFPLDDFPTISFISDSLLLINPSKIDTFLSFLSGNEDKVFDPGILLINGIFSFTRKYPHLLINNFLIDKCHIINEISLMTESSVSFHPKDTMIWGESS
ncbi:hypothetical protein Tco_1414344 [Tanacetum coccineum]